MHRLARPAPRAGSGRLREGRGTPTDWSAEARLHAAALDPDRMEKLARTLRLPADVLAALPLLGFHNRANDTAFIFPEMDAVGAVVGLNRRYADGTKKMLPGGTRGLTLPAGWRERPGPVFVVEGRLTRLP